MTMLPISRRDMLARCGTGLGTLRRDPDIRWRRIETALADMCNGQLALMRGAANGVAPGGRE